MDAHKRNDCHWTLRYTDKAVLNHMDLLLVRGNHPMAMRPGTQENRFCELARAGVQLSD
jgi:hypothetical protein